MADAQTSDPLTENEQLRAEIDALQDLLAVTSAQVESMQRSRWWRLNPRRVLRRQPAPTPGRTVAESVRARFRAEVIAAGTFSQEWFTWAIPDWEPVLASFAGQAVEGLEIGSFEGMSASFFLWRLPDAKITCIDTFGGSLEHHLLDVEISQLEERFDSNLARFDASRVRKLVGDSRRVLLDLVAEAKLYDFIYVDGSHEALDVLVDAALAWRLLARGGVLVFDDYSWKEFSDPLLCPGVAIDAFRGLVADRSELLFADHQLALRKLVVR